MKIIFIILLILNLLFGIINCTKNKNKPILIRIFNFNILTFLFMMSSLIINWEYFITH
jgi:hypothetical protein